MKTITVSKAQGFTDKPVTSTTLVIDAEISQQQTLEESALYYKSEATRIMRALAALPQGTKYQLLCLMLESAPVMYRGK